MKKGSNLISDKLLESKSMTKPLPSIKFNLSAHNLACFVGKDRGQPKSKGESMNDIKFLSQFKTIGTMRNSNVGGGRSIAGMSNFNESVVIMQYDNIDVYIDNSTRKKSNEKEGSESCSKNNLYQPQDSQADQFLQSCVRVVTEETDNSSNHLQQLGTPRVEEVSGMYDMYSMYNNCTQDANYSQEPKPRVVRNRQSVTVEESKGFVIQFENIVGDGRTTVMVKNIPNKYTQEMLLQEFTINFENKFDFFYLPIDKDNDCNVGYAFVNFINAGYLRDFYHEFHEQKWKRYKSPKICHICYARYQGTLQLADHFKHTKIINQKDRKLKPLMGLTEASKLKDLRQIIKNQRSQDLCANQ